MEPFKSIDVFLCDHEDDWIRHPIMYRGPIEKILGPWYTHFVDYYVCKECHYKLKDAINKYDQNE